MPLVGLGFAPAPVAIFETISELREASGIGGLRAISAADGALKDEGDDLGMSGGLGGTTCGFEFVAAGVAAGVVGILVCGVLGIGFESRFVGDGLEDFAIPSDVGIDFLDSSRTWLIILDVSGVTGDFGVSLTIVAGGGVCNSGFFAGAG